MMRAATQDDHKAILEIAKTSPYTNAYGSIMFSSPEAYQRGWIRVCSVGSHIAGFTCTRHYLRKAPKVKLYFINVRPELRSHGCGHRLLEDVMAHAAHRTMTLDVMKTNERAYKFYITEGFSVVGTALDDQAWAMEKTWP